MEPIANSEINFSKENDVLSKQNAFDLCRLCANAHDRLMPIFNGEGLALNISDKLEKYLPIIKVMESDELPLQICYQCTSILIAWHDLYEGCHLANQRLRGILAVDESSSDKSTRSYDFGDEADFELVKRSEDGEANPRMESGEARNWDIGEDRNKFDVNINETGTGNTNIGRLVTENHFKDHNILSTQPNNITCKCSPENSEKCSLCVGIYKCNFCPMVFMNKKKIEHHLHTSHPNTSPVNCTKRKCNSYSSKTSKKMKQKHQVNQPVHGDDVAESKSDSVSKSFKCKICLKICLTARGLVRHSVIHERKKIPAQSFSDNDARPIHVTEYHHIKSNATSSQVGSELRNFLAKESSLLEISTNARNESDQRQINTDELEIITDETMKAKIFTCSECSESFDQEEMLTLHQHIQHNKTNELVCKHCDEKFTDDKLLKQHLSSSHRKKRIKNSEMDDPFIRWYINVDGQKYLKCDQCKYNSLWYHKSRFLEHYRIHTGEKPFTCDMCQKQFRTKSLLSKHVMFVHEGIKEFPCTICGRRFSDKRYVTEHTRIHTNERPYICDLCGKSFRQSASLFVHKELHKGLRKFHCEMCPSKFTTRSSLNMHIKRHIGERNFICATCGKAFVDGKHLRDHMTVHSEERPFACKQCDRKFKLLKHLKQHGRTHK